MTPYQSHLRPDGTVFPPVTPDPPAPPGQEEILVPEIQPAPVQRSAPATPDEGEHSGTEPSAP